MKKILSVMLVSLFIAACAEKNEEYYFQNLDKAKEKLNSCEEEMSKAFMNRDEKKFEKVRDDLECQSAERAIKKQRQIERERERAEYERQRELKRQEVERQRKQEAERKQQELNDAIAAIKEKNAGNSWEENLTEFLKTDCVRGYSWGNQTPECTAWGTFYDEQSAKGKTELSAFTFEELSGKEADYCTKDKRDKSPCTVWTEVYAEKAQEAATAYSLFDLEQYKGNFCPEGSSYNRVSCRAWNTAWNEKSKALVKFFLDDYNSFKDAFNMCTTEIQKIQDSDLKSGERYKQIDKLRSMSPCKQARDAHSERGLGYNNFKTLVP